MKSGGGGYENSVSGGVGGGIDGFFSNWKHLAFERKGILQGIKRSKKKIA